MAPKPQADAVKRGPGRPKGTVNGPAAGPVGRPPKGGGLPRNKKKEELKQTKLCFHPGTSTDSSEQVFGGSVSAPPKNCDRPPIIQTSHTADARSNPPTGLAVPAANIPITVPELPAELPLTVASPNSTPRSAALHSVTSLDHASHGAGVPAILEYVPVPAAATSSDEDHSYILDDEDADEDNDEAQEFRPLPDDDEGIFAFEPSTLPTLNAAASVQDRDRVEYDRKSRSAAPLWLQDMYYEFRERLIAEMKANASERPNCYDHGSYTIGGPIRYQDAVKKIVSPRDFWTPFFFVWLPHLFMPGRRILCPACVQAHRLRPSDNKPVTLQLNGWPDLPRRVVDIEYSIYIIGQRYRCGQSECKKTYQCWSPALLSVLPPALAAEFTHMLTYRGGLTSALGALLRSNVRNGIGPSAFRDMILSFHHRYHEQLEVRYLEHVRSRVDAVKGGMYGNQKFPPFGQFNDRNGYSGYVPSRTYFRLFYTDTIEKHARDMNQHMSMLSGKYLVGDHSFKVSNRLARVSGQSIFGALHTTVNEYTEIRQMILTHTKAHDQFMPALRMVSESLRTYGHDEVELFFTDNVRGDKAELERCFPSLLRDVHPVPDHSSLDPLIIPSEDWSIFTLSSEYQIRIRLNCILEDLTKLHVDDELKVGFDMEWPVDRVSGIHGRVAIIQILYGSNIFILQLYSCLRDGYLHLPHPLLTFLRSDRIRKVGVGVKRDLTRLFKDCNFQPVTDAPFAGALELGELAKSRNAADRATIGLADLVARVLHCHLAKDDSVRVSKLWSEPVLSQDQVRYAALDVYASWRVFEALSSSPTAGKPVTALTPEGTAVDILSQDHFRVVARGIILSDRPKLFCGVNVSKTRVLVKVTKLEVPGYCVPAELISTKQATSLLSLLGDSPLPFTILYKYIHLRTSTPTSAMSDSSSQSTSGQSIPALALPSSGSGSTSDTQDMSPDTDDEVSEHWYDNVEFSPTGEQSATSSEHDEPSYKRAIELRAEIEQLRCDNERVIHSRILGDIWHLMDQFKVSVHHGLRRPFTRALRDAIFIPDPEDKTAVDEVLHARGTSYDAMLLSHPEWIHSRVKRHVPAPAILVPRVMEVFTTYGPLKDAKTNQVLFNEAAWDTGISLYFVRGKDKSGLTLYRSLRGTNHVEGGVHQNIIQRFSAYNASPEFAVNLLRDYALCHNLKVGTLNRTGSPYQGSYDIWTRNQISHLRNLTEDIVASTPHTKSDWINGWDYECSKETFGVLPIAAATRAQFGMLDNVQQTRHAILPVHTAEERALFRLMAGDTKGLFAGKSHPSWIAVAAEWSGHCDGLHDRIAAPGASQKLLQNMVGVLLNQAGSWAPRNSC